MTGRRYGCGWTIVGLAVIVIVAVALAKGWLR
jgi:hypothetical protein